MKLVEKFIAVATALVLLATLVGGIVLPLLDLFDIDISYLNQDLVDKIQIIDFPENDQGVIDLRKQLGAGLGFAVLTLAIAGLILINHRKSARVKSVSVQFRRFAEIYTQSFNENFERLEAIEKLNASGDLGSARNTLDKITVSNKDFLRIVCNILSAISKTYFGRSCAVNIKSYSADSEGIETFARDGASHDARKYTDDKYKSEARRINQNSIFQNLSNAQGGFFISNNLKKLARDGGYSNHANPEWEKHYNACMVIAIRSRSISSDNRRLLGFICIDNKNGGFKEDYFLELSRVVSDLMYAYFDIIITRTRINDEMLNQKKSEPEEGMKDEEN